MKAVCPECNREFEFSLLDSTISCPLCAAKAIWDEYPIYDEDTREVVDHKLILDWIK
jgi:hypothetical protein